MSLTYEDLQQIRSVVKEEVKPLRGDIEALTNDIKEIYSMISDLHKRTTSLEKTVTSFSNNITADKDFEKLSLEKKIIRFHREIVAAAKQAGVTLPSH